MPSRRRHRERARAQGSMPPVPDVERFATGLKDTEKRAREQRLAAERRAADKKAAAKARAEAAAALAAARRELDAAIAAVRSAKGAAAAEANARWRAAKAKVIELETGSLPAWAATNAGSDGDDDHSSDDDGIAGEPDAAGDGAAGD
ncbi:MAG: hypothetical protein ACKOYG_08810 [Ilumatobacteraceae bacterium]